MVNDLVVQRMIDRHEFLRFEYRAGQASARCYCGNLTRSYLSEGNATSEHKRHQRIELAPADSKMGGMGR